MHLSRNVTASYLLLLPYAGPEISFYKPLPYSLLGGWHADPDGTATPENYYKYV